MTRAALDELAHVAQVLEHDGLPRSAGTGAAADTAGVDHDRLADRPHRVRRRLAVHRPRALSVDQPAARRRPAIRRRRRARDRAASRPANSASTSIATPCAASAPSASRNCVKPLSPADRTRPRGAAATRGSARPGRSAPGPGPASTKTRAPAAYIASISRGEAHRPRRSAPRAARGSRRGSSGYGAAVVFEYTRACADRCSTAVEIARRRRRARRRRAGCGTRTRPGSASRRARPRPVARGRSRRRRRGPESTHWSGELWFAIDDAVASSR